ncbi:MAG: sulfotransferase [Halioglobus sp.]
MTEHNEPDSPEEYLRAATAHMKEKAFMQAFSICVVGLDRYPENGRLLCQAAQTCIALGRVREARLYIDTARPANVGMSLVHELHGDLCLLEDKPGEATKSYRQADKLDPGREGLSVRVDRARQMMTANKPAQGKRRQVLAFPEEIARAGQLERDGEPGKAENIYRDILRRDPEHVEAMRKLAEVAAVHSQYGDAEVYLRRAVGIAPDYARLWLDLAAAQMEQDKLEDAIASTRQLVELTPNIAESHIALGNALARADLAEKAEQAYRAALLLKPYHAGALSGLAQQLKTLGGQEEAIAVHRENLLRNPKNAEPWWSLANMKTYGFSDQDLQSMETQLGRDDLTELSRVQLHNALGFAWEKREDYDKAFRHFSGGNELRRKSEIYDPVENEVSTSRVIKVFTPELLQRYRSCGDTDSSPIFIVGLPRSGSTLIEQILASHSQVEGTHELSDLPQVVHSMPRANKRERFPDNLPGLKPELFTRFGRDYLDRTRRYREGAVYFIDKNPNNFTYVGLLQLMLPGAKIINARRHPIDSCFGSYKQLFASGQPFSYDLTDIGEYYLQYQRLMDHWHEVLPGKVLDVQYEAVVDDLEQQVRRILDYCGLPFEQACVEFHRTERAVKTASSEQVRQPIYGSSVNLWKRYETHLGELQEVLEPLL